MDTIRLLVADDEQQYLDLLQRRFSRRGYEVTVAKDGGEAWELLQKSEFDVGLYDFQMPVWNGIELLKMTKDKYPNMQVLMITGQGSIESAITAMKEGAYDYLIKPGNFEEMELMIEKAYEKKNLLQQNIDLREVLKRSRVKRPMIGRSNAIQSVQDIIQKVAPTDSTVLIEGESGTGKELVAEHIYELSGRSDQPFIILNAGALPNELLESELFGHAKGAFTGAHEEKKGLFEVADKGTLFLDEIGEMDMGLQVKLLRFLETGEVRRVGDNRTKKVDVRIIAATNRRLEKEVPEGRFRQDLYYRLNVIKIIVPPLRERTDDIPILANYFLNLYDKSAKKSLSDKAKFALQNYSFPGNIRELANLIQRGTILSTGEYVQPEDLFIGDIQEELQEQNLTLRDVERRHIIATIQTVSGNKSQAAQLLGISVRNLYRKLQEYEMQDV